MGDIYPPFFMDKTMDTKICPKCGTRFIGGKHYWAGTAKEGNLLDLAGLVCNRFSDETCINPCKGQTGGDTWEKRMAAVDAALDQAMARINEEFL
jgi:hypothetical protein